MGWRGMGAAPRAGVSRISRNAATRRPDADIRSWRVVRKYDASRAPPSKRKHPVPRVGRRVGELTVTGYKIGVYGGLISLVVKCSCGAPEHFVDPHNFFAGRTTRCNACAKKAAGYWTKKYYGYADVCPDEKHRRRLMGRISVIYNRCRCETDASYADYGGRGIQVYGPWRNDRRAFLAHLVTLPGWDDPKLEIDRENNQGGYVPGNIRFTTKGANTRNRRKFRQLEDEITDLRHRFERAEKQIHSCVRCRPAYRAQLRVR